jgi:hypothetical protein
VVAEGKVRVAGISGEKDVIAATLTGNYPALRTAQFAGNLDNFGFLDEIAGEASPNLANGPSRMFLVANHPFGGALGIGATRRRIAELAADPTLPQDLRAKLDPADPQLLPEIILNAILTGTGIDAIVPAMLKPAHLASNCRAIAECRFTPGELGWLRHALASRP